VTEDDKAHQDLPRHLRDWNCTEGNQEVLEPSDCLASPALEVIRVTRGSQAGRGSQADQAWRSKVKELQVNQVSPDPQGPPGSLDSKEPPASWASLAPPDLGVMMADLVTPATLENLAGQVPKAREESPTVILGHPGPRARQETPATQVSRVGTESQVVEDSQEGRGSPGRRVSLEKTVEMDYQVPQVSQG